MSTRTDAVRPDAPAATQPLTTPTRAQRRHVLAAASALLGASAVTALAATTTPPVDAGLRTWVRGLPLGGAVTWFAGDGARILLVLAGLLVVLVASLASRCRALPGAVVLTVVLAALSGTALGALVDVLRPATSEVPTGSWPSDAVLALTVVTGLLGVVTGPVGLRSLEQALVVSAGVVVTALVAVSEVHAGTSWPLDVVGAALLGTLVVAVVRVGTEDPRHHRRCAGCPWQVSADSAPAAPVVDVPESRAHVLRLGALVWVLALVAGFGLLAATVGLPRSPESGVMGTGLEVPLQWGLVAVLVLSVLASWRWHLTGAMVAAFAGALLGFAASVEYPATVALAIAVVAWVPAFLLWWGWQHRASLRAVVAVAAAASVVVVGVVSAAAQTYASYWGPTHPRSLTAPPATDVVSWMWLGALTSSGADVRLRTADPSDEVAVVVSTSPDLTPRVATATGDVDGDRVAAVRLDGLEPGTRYWYAAEVDGDLVDERVQSFTTAPEGPGSFSFVVGSCQVGGSNGQVFDVMRSLDPLLVLSTGDWNYGNVERNRLALFQDQYDLNLTAPAQAELYGSTAFAYAWGDHDFGGNDADRTSPSREASMAAYRQLTPHYALRGGPDDTIEQAFTVGRVRFLLLDTRSARDPAGDVTGAFRTTLGDSQREWLVDELSRAGDYGAVVLVNPDPWVEEEDPAGDGWGGFAQERRVVADAVAASGAGNVLMVAGDAHMLAWDDGTHTDYSTSGAGGFPLLHAAAVDRPGSVKGGPYTGPVLPGGGQFGHVEVQDDGTTVTVTAHGVRWDGETLFTRTVTFGP
ncbi:alkaline phosphatase D family protein [Thalassiella azotivora]